MKRQALIFVEEEVPDDWDQRICYEVEVTAKNGETVRRLNVVRIMPDSAWDLKKNPHVMTRRETYFYSRGWIEGYDEAKILCGDVAKGTQTLFDRAFDTLGALRSSHDAVSREARSNPNFQVLRRNL